ncbi:MAG TPA: GerW family sporulation protein [Firmicutes bacterium]|nr:GerW family sporulation protein [Bacillota bacterium]
MAAEHPIQGLMGVTMEKIREMVDVNTIIGTPITTPDGTMVIPVSKVAFGFGSGGSDFPSKTAQELFGGGTGAGVSIQPIAFIVIANGDVRLLQMTENTSSVDKIVDSMPDIIGKIKELIPSKSKKKESDAEASETENM